MGSGSRQGTYRKCKFPFALTGPAMESDKAKAMDTGCASYVVIDPIDPTGDGSSVCGARYHGNGICPSLRY